MHIEVTDEQYKLLSENAKRCGLTKRAYLMRLVEGTPIRARPSEEIKALRTEIHHIGNNINQIARIANAGYVRPDEIRDSLFLLAKVYELMDRVANP